MIEHLGEYAWIAATLAGIGYLLVPIIGYFRRPRNGNVAPAMFPKAMMFDSSIAGDMLAQVGEQVVHVRRQADAAEALVEIEKGRDKRAAEARHDSELETLRREIEELKRLKR